MTELRGAISSQEYLMEKPGPDVRRSKLVKMLAAIAIAVTVVVIVVAVAALCSVLHFLGSIDDPFRPRAPDYRYEASVSGLEGFTTADGSATIRLPLPGVDGAPLLMEGWWANYPPDPWEKRHGMLSLGPVNTTEGPMLEARLNMTDYYLSYARVTPIAIMPGQNTSALPEPEPERVSKPWSFDDVHVIASGYIEPLDYPTGSEGRAAVKEFLVTPLLPVAYVPEGCTIETEYQTYVYIDPALKPLTAGSELRVKGTMTVTLNHNKVNASEEGKRSFEYHTYKIDETIPGGRTGYVPVQVQYSYHAGISGPA
jgi:hypothetical protein